MSIAYSQTRSDQRRADDRAYYALNRDKILAYQVRYSREHKEKKKEYDRAYCAKPEIRQKHAQRERTQYRRSYRAQNRDRLMESERNYRAENRDRLLRSRRESYVINRRKYLVMAAKQRARICGVPFDLRAPDIEWPEVCPVLGLRLNYENVQRGENTPSLDRVIAANGYVLGNVRVISMRANRLKSDATAEELRRLAAYVTGT